ncbi:hypothetical protein D3C87_1723430 [compost metagenome]
MTGAAVFHQEFHETGECLVAGAVDDGAGFPTLRDQPGTLQLLEVKRHVRCRNTHALRDHTCRQSLRACDDQRADDPKAGLLGEGGK